MMLQPLHFITTTTLLTVFLAMLSPSVVSAEPPTPTSASPGEATIAEVQEPSSAVPSSARAIQPAPARHIIILPDGPAGALESLYDAATLRLHTPGLGLSHFFEPVCPTGILAHTDSYRNIRLPMCRNHCPEGSTAEPDENQGLVLANAIEGRFSSSEAREVLLQTRECNIFNMNDSTVLLRHENGAWRMKYYKAGFDTSKCFPVFSNDQVLLACKTYTAGGGVVDTEILYSAGGSGSFVDGGAGMRMDALLKSNGSRITNYAADGWAGILQTVHVDDRRIYLGGQGMMRVRMESRTGLATIPLDE